MLTAKQNELWRFISEYTHENRGTSPSFDEMKAHLGLRSKSGVHRLVTSLVDRGFIRRYRARARSIEVIRKPEGIGPTCPNCGASLNQRVAS